MINVDDVTKGNIIGPEIPDHPYRKLIIGGSGCGKTSSLFNLINQQPDINKTYLHDKDPYEAKFLVNKQEGTGLKHFNNSKAFIEYSNDPDDIYKNIEEYNPNKKRKILIVFDNMIAHMLSIKKLNPTVTELFIRGRKLNISHIFITQSYFAVPKKIRLNSTNYFILKIPNKQKLQQILCNHSSDIDFQNFVKLFKRGSGKPYSFLVIDATPAPDNPLRIRKNLFEQI